MDFLPARLSGVAWAAMVSGLGAGDNSLESTIPFEWNCSPAQTGSGNETSPVRVMAGNFAPRSAHAGENTPSEMIPSMEADIAFEMWWAGLTSYSTRLTRFSSGPLIGFRQSGDRLAGG